MSSVVDETHSSMTMHRIGFGSCANQHKPTYSSAFDLLSSRAFDVFLLGGDAVYARNGELEGLVEAYDKVKELGVFEEFRKKTRVLGTWDDHDLGVNDGGRDVKDLLQRRDLFLDFLNVDKNDVRRTRRGVYSSFDFGSGNETIRIILLDTRFGRSGYPFSRIGSFGEGKWYGKIFPLIAAFSRGFFALTGITSRMIIPGQLMLDRDQWMWLESQLQTSTAKINILVSSVQVLTRNPTVESWGQFPQERTRLLKLLDSTKPKGLLIISGDVHVGEAMSIQGTAVPVEVTSSGLTHTCTDGGISPSICEFVWGLSNSPNREGLLLTRNYGEIDIDWKRSIFKVTVRDIENDANFFEFIRNFDALPSFDYDRVPSISPEPIVQQQLITFVAAVFVFALIFVLHVLRIIR